MTSGATVILEQTPRRRPASKGGLLSVSLEVPKTFAVDFNVQTFLDLASHELGRALQAGADRDLAKHYTYGRPTGSATTGTVTIRNTSRTADAYFARVFDRIAPLAIERATRKWVLAAMGG